MVEFYRDDKKAWRWRIKAENGRVVADSGQGYDNKVDAKHGLRIAIQILLLMVGDYMESIKI